VTSKVSGKKIQFDAKKLGDILGIPATRFDLYVWEDKSMLGKVRLLELAQKIGQQTGLQTPQSVKKGDMTSLHQLFFWFIRTSSPGSRTKSCRCNGSVLHCPNGQGGSNQTSCYNDPP